MSGINIVSRSFQKPKAAPRRPSFSFCPFLLGHTCKRPAPVLPVLYFRLPFLPQETGESASVVPHAVKQPGPDLPHPLIALQMTSPLLPFSVSHSLSESSSVSSLSMKSRTNNLDSLCSDTGSLVDIHDLSTSELLLLSNSGLQPNF